MGKLSVPNSLKRNDKLRKFPKLGEKLSKPQQKELAELVGDKSVLSENSVDK